MHNRKLASFAAVLMLTASSSVFAGDTTHAEEAIKESGMASGHASASTTHAIGASGQVTSAAVAVPLSAGGAVLGSVGAASTSAAEGLMNAATAPIGAPLTITDENVTAMPPDQALRPAPGTNQ